MFPLGVLRSRAREFVLDRQRRIPNAYTGLSAVEDHVRLMEPCGAIITSPYDIAVVEQLRAEATAGSSQVEKTPTDVFVLAWGEPADRRVTKIGGLPYWPNNRSWPLDDRGRELQFFAQFCFADSEFIRDGLPGDILLIFGDSEEKSAESLQCHWVSSGGSTPIDSSEAPQMKDAFLPLYGVLHRTYDYLAEQPAFSRYRGAEQLSRIEGTKIGGFPRWIQQEEQAPGPFICALGSVCPKSEVPYPYVNSQEPIGLKEANDWGLLKWGDAGSIYFFLRDDGQVDWAYQCY